MRHTTMLVMVGLGLATTAGEAAAFGRGGYAYRGVAYGSRGGYGYGGGYGRAYSGFYGSGYGGARGGSYTGPRGTTVQAGRAGGVASGPFGGVHAGEVGGVRVTTPGGQSYARGQAGGVNVGPYGGVRAGGVSRAATFGPYGASAVGRAGGVAVGPYGGVRAGGYVGHATGYISPYAMRTSAVAVRTAYPYRYFTPTWYTAHPAAWVAPRWVAPVWVPPVWGSVAMFVGLPAGVASANYDYGSSVVINDNRVYIDGNPTVSADDYAAQAAAMADAGRAAQPAPTDEWQPLGQFGLIQENETLAQRIFQLGVNKAGVVRGNYYDAVADTTLPVYGTLEKSNQRVAWSIGEKKDIVFEAGLGNLTKPEATVLVHFGKDRTEQMMLVRLDEPKDDKK